jgi:hypothetical protein
MKSTKCRNCDGKGNVHIDIPEACSKVFDIPCWICGGVGFKGMSGEQIKWYMDLHKAFDKLKKACLRAEECVSPMAWQSMKNSINLACSRLGVPTPSVPFVKATAYGVTQKYLTIKTELQVFEKRLESIPVAVAAKSQKAD